MVYDISDIDDNNSVQFVAYLNDRNWNIEYSNSTPPSENSGGIEPQTLIFISDDANCNGMTYLIVGYKTSASISIYSSNCGANRNYKKNTKPRTPHPTSDAETVDQCMDQSPCLNVDIRLTLSFNSFTNNQRRRILNNNNEEMYEICIGFDNNNPYCLKE